MGIPPIMTFFSASSSDFGLRLCGDLRFCLGLPLLCGAQQAGHVPVPGLLLHVRLGNDHGAGHGRISDVVTVIMTDDWSKNDKIGKYMNIIRTVPCLRVFQRRGGVRACGKNTNKPVFAHVFKDLFIFFYILSTDCSSIFTVYVFGARHKTTPILFMSAGVVYCI